MRKGIFQGGKKVHYLSRSYKTAYKRKNGERERIGHSKCGLFGIVKLSDKKVDCISCIVEAKRK